jgi:hypothetical protein
MRRHLPHRAVTILVGQSYPQACLSSNIKRLAARIAMATSAAIFFKLGYNSWFCPKFPFQFV